MRRGRCCTALEVLALCTLPFAGGLLYHIRGGWTVLPVLPPDDAFTHLLLQRLIWSLPTGAMAWLTARRLHFTLPALCLAALCLLSLYVGWGTYLGLGHNPASYNSRPGVWDWLLGRGQVSWADESGFARRWVREAAGMSLRGCLQTAVPGLLLLAYGYGATYLLSGIGMGFIYTLGWAGVTGSGQLTPWGAAIAEPAIFAAGVPLSEILWGTWTWLVLGAVILSVDGAPLRPTASSSSPLSWWRRLLPSGHSQYYGPAAHYWLAAWLHNNSSSDSSSSSSNSSAGGMSLLGDDPLYASSSASVNRSWAYGAGGAAAATAFGVGGGSGSSSLARRAARAIHTWLIPILIHAWILVQLGLFIGALNYYSGITQSDERDKVQGLIGLGAVLGATAVGYALYVATKLAMWRIQRTQGCSVAAAWDVVVAHVAAAAAAACCCMCRCRRRSCCGQAEVEADGSSAQAAGVGYAGSSGYDYTADLYSGKRSIAYGLLEDAVWAEGEHEAVTASAAATAEAAGGGQGVRLRQPFAALVAALDTVHAVCICLVVAMVAAPDAVAAAVRPLAGG